MDTRGRLHWMDMLRGGAILAVVMHHSISQVAKESGGSLGLLSTVNDALSPFRMPVLMFLSGMLLHRSLSKDARHYFRGKFAGIGWPYVLWSLLTLALLSATAPLTGLYVGWEDFASILYSPPTYHWYLAYLLLYYVIAWLLPPVARTGLILPLLVASGFAVGPWNQLLYLAAFFLAGDAFTRYQRPLLQLAQRTPTMVLFGLLALVAAIASATGEEVRYSALWSPCIAGAPLALRSILIPLEGTTIGKGLAAVGRQSIVYYVSHYMVVMAVGNALALAGVTSAWPLLAAIFVAACVTGYLLVGLRRTPVGDLMFVWPVRPRETARRAA